MDDEGEQRHAGEPVADLGVLIATAGEHPHQECDRDREMDEDVVPIEELDDPRQIDHPTLHPLLREGADRAFPLDDPFRVALLRLPSSCSSRVSPARYTRNTPAATASSTAAAIASGFLRSADAAGSVGGRSTVSMVTMVHEAPSRGRPPPGCFRVILRGTDHRPVVGPRVGRALSDQSSRISPGRTRRGGRRCGRRRRSGCRGSGAPSERRDRAARSTGRLRARGSRRPARGRAGSWARSR